MNSPKMRSFWVDFPLNAEQYSKLKIKWRRRHNNYEIQNQPQPELRIRSFCTFGGDDYQIISIEVRGDVEVYAETLEAMDKWIKENLGEY